MLGEKYAAAVDKALCCRFLCGLIIPGTSECYVHGNGGAYGLCTEVEGCVTGDNFRVCVSADIAHFGLVCSDLAGFDHLIELESGCNADEETAHVDVCKSIVIVGKFLGCRHIACSGDEVDIRALFRGCEHVALVAVAVGEDNIAALVYEVESGIFAGLVLRDLGLDYEVSAFNHSVRFEDFLRRIQEVCVIGGVLVVEEDKADFYGRSRGFFRGGCFFGCRGCFLSGSGFLGCGGSGLTAGCKCKYHTKCEDKC